MRECGSNPSGIPVPDFSHRRKQQGMKTACIPEKTIQPESSENWYNIHICQISLGRWRTCVSEGVRLQNLPQGVCTVISTGVEKAWELLGGLDPGVVCANAAAGFEAAHGNYIVKSFCADFLVNPGERSVRSENPQGEAIMNRFGHFFLHSCLWYLVHAKEISFSGKLISPVNIRGGGMFFRGSHILPLEALAKRYGNDRQSFIQKGQELCAEILDFGDASLRLFPMPRILVTIILWFGDDEFSPRADLLLDSSCEMQVPLDIIWSTAMLTALVMM